jgi:D-alanyl-D-alanine carboxypeptidase (penicillin-binding protein 5/6)
MKLVDEKKIFDATLLRQRASSGNDSLMKRIALIALLLTAVSSAAAPTDTMQPSSSANTVVPLPQSKFIVPAPPALNAKAWILIDFQSGTILAQNNADARMEPASITKIMTIYTLAELLKSGRVKLTDTVSISTKARSMTGSRMFVEQGATVVLEDLMKGDIIQSGNDASVALAEYAAGSEDAFAALMNQNAVRLGMTGTHFANSTGLPDPNHYTTAHDLARLSIALIRDHSDIYRWFSIKEFTYHGITQANRNKLLASDPSVDGIKTGFHEAAGYCLAASAVRDNMRLIAIVLGTDSETVRADAAQALLNYGYQFYESPKIFTGQKPIKASRVWKGEAQEVPVGIAQDLYVTIPRGSVQRLASVISYDSRLIAPLQYGQQVGTLAVTLDGKTVATRPAVALQEVKAGGFVTRVIDAARLLFESK